MVINSPQFPLEMPAMPPWSPPIEGEAQRVDIVGCGFVDVGRGDFRDRSGERHEVVGLIVARARGP